MNVEAFKELINIYSDFTVEELTEFWIDDGKTTMRELTGFSSNNCTLCIAANHRCENCVYYGCATKNGKYVACVDNTYEAIEYSQTPEELYSALQKRIEYMKQLLKLYEE